VELPSKKTNTKGSVGNYFFMLIFYKKKLKMCFNLYSYKGV